MLGQPTPPLLNARSRNCRAIPTADLAVATEKRICLAWSAGASMDIRESTASERMDEEAQMVSFTCSIVDFTGDLA